MLRRLPIRTRLIVAFSVLVLLLVALGVTSVWLASKQNEAFNGFHQRVMMSALGSPDQVNAAGVKWRSAAASAEASLKELEAGVRDPENQVLVETFAEGLAAYTQNVGAAIPLLADASLSSGATEKVIAGLARLASAEAALKEALTAVDRFAGAVVERMNGLYSMALKITLAVLALGVAVVVGLGWRVGLSIEQPTEAAKAFADRIRDGDPTARIDAEGRDESTVLARYLHEMQDRLCNIAGSVRASVDSMHIGNAKVAAGNAGLRQRTERTAAELARRGFAVVTGEVRSLAGRSAEAAREIKALIGASVERVESGSRLMQDAGTTLNEIVASAQRVTNITAETSAAAREQSQGIGEVNTAANRLDQRTQQNAALVEQSTAAAASLKEQSRKLAQIVATFRLSPGGAGA